MAIKELTTTTLGKHKAGWTWDKRRKLFYTFVLDTTFNGERFVKRGFSSEKEADDFLEKMRMQERLKEIGYTQIVKYPTFQELITKHIKSLATKREQTRAERVLKSFAALLPKGATINQVSRKYFKDFSDKRLETDKVKSETVNRDLNCIASAIHKVNDYFQGLENWMPPKIYRPAREDDARQRVVSKDEREQLIPYLLREREPKEKDDSYLARRRSALVLYFGLLTGLRHGEISGLRKTNFDQSARRLKAERFKTKKKGTALTIFEPLTDIQMWVLHEAKELYPESPYFFSEFGKNYNKIYSILKNAAKVLGIKYGRFTEGGFIIHDTRHTFITNLLQNGVDIATAKSLSGHRTNDMLIRYSHTNAESRKVALQIASDESTNFSEAKEVLNQIYNEVLSGGINFENFNKRIMGVFRKSENG